LTTWVEVACAVSATAGGIDISTPPNAMAAADPNTFVIAHQLSTPGGDIQAIRVAPSRQATLD
jgi:hypothetical protein